MNEGVMASREPLRVLFLATYFPKPKKPTMGVWALAQAQALIAQGVDVRVVSPVPWFPRVLLWALRFSKRLGRLQAWGVSSRDRHLGRLRVTYLPWAFYGLGPFRDWQRRSPAPHLIVGWLSVRRRLLALVAEFQPDLVYVHESAVSGYLARQLHRRTGVPYTITDHGFDDITDCERWPRRRRVLEPIVNEAALMVPSNRRMESDIRRIFPRARTRRVWYAAQRLPEMRQWSEKPPELHEKLVVFSAGLMYPQRGFPELIRAFASVASRHSNAVLRIAGDGADRPTIEKVICKESLEDRVKLLGLLSPQDVLREMAWCDFFALLAWDEVFSGVCMEAMAAGKPIVCANDGGINDVIEDGVHGFAVAPRDEKAAAGALDDLLSNEPLRRRMGQAAKELFEARLTWQANAESMVAVFHDVLADRVVRPERV
jgi:glycosyltransferase involved in cell wall biosynthesis